MVGIIFDCDGTLIDSELAHYLSWQMALAQQGIELTENDYCPLAGNPGIYVATQLCKKFEIHSPDKIALDKNQFYLELHRQGIPPITRTVNFVHELVKHKSAYGFKLAVASAAHKNEILINLEHLGIADVFDAIVSGVDDLVHISDPEGVNKPKPYIYLQACELLDLKPNQCVAFEDSSPGLLAAVRAGLTTFAVPNKFTRQQNFSSANFVVDTAEPLMMTDFLKKIKNQ